MTNDSQIAFGFPAICRKKVVASFDGGRLTSDGGVLLLSGAEKRLGICAALTGCVRDRRDQSRVIHDYADMLRSRIFAICHGYEDADDLDALRDDPGFKMALGKAPQAAHGLCSQPTMSRLENAPRRTEVGRMMVRMIDLYCASYPSPPAAVTLDIDDTLDRVHGGQQLAFWNGFHRERCFLPILVFDDSGRQVAAILRTGKTPSGAEARRWIAHLVRHIRRHWPATKITIRGDSHYGRPEVMDWCNANRIGFIFGLAGTAPLKRDPAIEMVADEACVLRAEQRRVEVRLYAETRYAAGTWQRPERVVARIEASIQGLDIRFVVTNIEQAQASAERVYDTLYCARGNAENMIKRFKTELAGDRTSCSSPVANQLRLVLHMAAYQLMWTLQDAIPKSSPLKTAQFATLRDRLLKVAARVIETTTRIRIRFASACPDADLFRHLAKTLHPTPT